MFTVEYQQLNTRKRKKKKKEGGVVPLVMEHFRTF